MAEPIKGWEVPEDGGLKENMDLATNNLRHPKISQKIHKNPANDEFSTIDDL